MEQNVCCLSEDGEVCGKEGVGSASFPLTFSSNENFGQMIFSDKDTQFLTIPVCQKHLDKIKEPLDNLDRKWIGISTGSNRQNVG